jgi:chitinase
VFFHPTTFEIMPMNMADVDLYRESTNLKTNKLQTWVAIGGVSLAQLLDNSSSKPVD